MSASKRIDNHRVLVVGPSWVGDMIMAQSLFKVIRNQHPHGHICVLAPPWTRPLVERMPEVDSSRSLPIGHGKLDMGARIAISRKLRRDCFDQAIVLPGSLKSALIPLLAGIPRRTGYLGELRWGLLNDIRQLDRSRLELTVDRFVALGLGESADKPRYEFPSLRADEDNTRVLLERLNLDTRRPIIALCPGAEYGPAKRWPAEHFAALAEHFMAQNHQIWLFGSAKDSPIAEKINALTQDRCSNLCGLTSLCDAIDLLRLAHLAVTNDSGLMHIAAAIGRPLVAIYGSSTPAFTPPLCDEAAIVSLDLACSPCFKRDCPLGHTDCLVQLPPQRVVQAAARLLR